MKYIKCSKCNHIHFEVTRSKAQEEVDAFNTYYDNLDPVDQLAYYGGHKSHIKSYEHCMFCNEIYVNFVDAIKNDIDEAYGHTVNPIIKWDE
jgi:hypothetical protein